MTTLLIIESSGKIPKIKEALGSKYDVISSGGHVWDLKDVVIADNFRPVYTKKNQTINKLKTAMSKATDVVLATDDDREGWAIAYSITQSLGLQNPKRMVFTDVTKKSLLKAIANVQSIDMCIVESQQCRACLDMIIGYQISGLLGFGKSAGRVQSVALKLLVEKEHDINKFNDNRNNDSSFYKVTGNFNYNFQRNSGRSEEESSSPYKDEELVTSLCTKDNKKNNKPVDIDNYDNCRLFLEKCKVSTFTLLCFEKKKSKKNPPPPYITATYQQDAFNKYGLSAKKAMDIAQVLYQTGHITYMRTDSVNQSQYALDQIKNYILNTYDKTYYQSRTFKSDDITQDAHEAIRPTKIELQELPEHKDFTEQHKKIYNMIWKRSVATQMSSAVSSVYDYVINISNVDEYVFSGKKEYLEFLGFLVLYDKEIEQDKLNGKMLVGDVVHMDQIICTENYKKPPARYTEASLIKKAKDLGIGRPSTYQSLTITLKKRKYITEGDVKGTEKASKILTLSGQEIVESDNKVFIGKETRKLIPTESGISVTEYLVEHFREIMEYKYTSDMEDKLTAICEGKGTRLDTLKEFYATFEPLVKACKQLKDEKYIGQLNSGDKLYVCPTQYDDMVKVVNSEGKTINKLYLKPPLNKDNVTAEQVEALLNNPYPKDLGKYKKYDKNFNVLIKKGQYGLYISFGPFTHSIEKDVDYQEAIKIIDNEHNKYHKTWSDDTKIYVLMKHDDWGYYLKWFDTKTKKNGNISIPFDIKVDNAKVMSITLEQIKEFQQTKKAYTKKSYKN